MKCLLAAAGFINADIEHNKRKIIAHLQQYSGTADVIVFGEAFLHGFYAASFDFQKDKGIALEVGSPVVAEISRAARDNHIAVSFGFIEKCGEKLYSSQITIGADGKVLDLYHRVSPGWKEWFADEHYVEGDSFHTFSFHGNTVAIGLCGDLWYEENLAAIQKLSADVIFWPVYTDFNYDVWNSEEKYVYAKQVSKIAPYVLYVNSVCIDKEGDEIARGGAALFSDGNILSEIPAGKEDVLLVEI